MSGLAGDIGNRVNDVKNTFSSWDSCMSKTYCKWPVIAGIVVGGLILLSVVWCIASCLCCGATLCGSCVQCLTCFRCCGACGKGRGGGGGGGGTKYKDEYTKVPSPYNGYQPQASPMAYQPSSGPQYAQFDAPGKKIHADSLPAMPSWETARKVRVEDQTQPKHGYDNDVEMGVVNTSQPVTRTRGGYNQVSNGPISPISASAGYGRFEGQTDSYHSDLGAQRLNQQQTGYADYDHTPLSPAPTYRTNPLVAAGGQTDRFARGTMSPAPSEYSAQRNYAPPRNQAWSPLPGPQHDHTEYEPYRRSLSPPLESPSSPYGHQQQDYSAARPPSLLQIGRKPVHGSQREV